VEQSDVEMQWEKDGKTKNAAVIAFRSKEAADAAQGELKSLHVPSGVYNWPLTIWCFVCLYLECVAFA
jgi:hypothetical protein